jgi:hypothetical protein
MWLKSRPIDAVKARKGVKIENVGPKPKVKAKPSVPPPAPAPKVGKMLPVVSAQAKIVDDIIHIQYKAENHSDHFSGKAYMTKDVHMDDLDSLNSDEKLALRKALSDTKNALTSYAGTDTLYVPLKIFHATYSADFWTSDDIYYLTTVDKPKFYEPEPDPEPEPEQDEDEDDEPEEDDDDGPCQCSECQRNASLDDE